jgi:hypothetical protein
VNITDIIIEYKSAFHKINFLLLFIKKLGFIIFKIPKITAKVTINKIKELV